MVEYHGDYAATDEERAEIKRAVKCHQERLEAEKDEIRKNEIFVSRIGKSYNGTIELYREFENRNVEYITELGMGIGLMAKIKEEFKRDNRLRQLTEYFMRLYGAEMEELYGEIEYYRQTVKELQGLSGR